MPADFLKSERRWIVIIPVAIIVVSVVVWFVTRETLSKTIRIATAQDGGPYHEFGEALKKFLISRDETIERSSVDLYFFSRGCFNPADRIGQATQLVRAELRSDQAFSVFILQGGNLISKIQMKILNYPSP